MLLVASVISFSAFSKDIDPTKLYKSIPAHEQKITRVMVSTFELYLVNKDYTKLQTQLLKSAFPNINAGRLTDVQEGDFEGVEVYVLPENPKIAVFTLKSNNCPAGIESMQKNLTNLKVVPNSSHVKCTPAGFIIQSAPKK